MQARELRSQLLVLEEAQNHNDTSDKLELVEKKVMQLYKKFTSVCSRSKLPTYDEIDDKITILGNELEEMKVDVNSKQSSEGKFCGKAFIIFNSQIEAERMSKYIVPKNYITPIFS